MLHFEHAILVVEAMDMVLILTGVVGARTIFSSRSVNGRCEIFSREVVQTDRDIDPGEPSNMRSLLALEWTQVAPQRVCLNDVA